MKQNNQQMHPILQQFMNALHTLLTNANEVGKTIGNQPMTTMQAPQPNLRQAAQTIGGQSPLTNMLSGKIQQVPQQFQQAAQQYVQGLQNIGMKNPTPQQKQLAEQSMGGMIGSVGDFAMSKMAQKISGLDPEKFSQLQGIMQKVKQSGISSLTEDERSIFGSMSFPQLRMASPDINPGELQEFGQAQRGLPLLANLDQAIKAKDPQAIQVIKQAILNDPAYAQYHYAISGYGK